MRTTQCLLSAILILLHAPMGMAQTPSIPANSIAFGLGYNSADSYKFGEFNGITDQGGFAVGQFNLRSRADNTTANNSFWSIEASNLGLDTGAFSADYGQHGRFVFFLKGDQLPHYRFSDGRSPFRGSGSTAQTLPANWVGSNSTAGFTELPASLLPVRIDKKRERLSSGVTWHLDKAWSISGEYRHETKRGEGTLGAIFGSTGGNPRGALLSRPVDFETDDISVGLSYGGTRSQYNLSYNAILFSNKDKALRWQNPFNNPQWTNGANFSDGAFGQMALEPDTSSSQIAFSGAHSFADNSRFSGSLISTRLQQDDSFLPYSSAISATTPLPRNDLNAKVDMLVANLNYSRRINRRALLRLRYNYQERDNKTPQSLYLRIAGDSAQQATVLSNNARRNRIYDLESSRFNADLSYQLGAGNKLSLGVEHEVKDRSSVDVATTKEDTGFIKLNVTPGTLASGWIKLSRAQRDASTYDSTVPFRAGHNPDYIATLVGNEIFENDPLLRRFHLTDRERDELSAAISFYPSALVGVNVMGKKAKDDYPDAVTGLQQSERQNLAVDVSYTPEADWRASIYYNIDNYDNFQAGFGRRGGGNPTPFYPPSVRDPGNAWTMRSEDKVHTIGTSVDWVMLDGRLQLEMDASYADAVTTTSPFSSGQSWETFPDISTLIKSVSLQANYQLRANREIRLRYYYENYSSTDWALDAVAVDTLSNVLLLGNQSPRYNGHLFLFSYIISFDN